jgi:hypothetical protein
MVVLVVAVVVRVLLLLSVVLVVLVVAVVGLRRVAHQAVQVATVWLFLCGRRGIEHEIRMD